MASEEHYTAPLASLSLTHVYYDPTDPLSHLSAYLALLPQALVIVYTTLLLATREAEVALMFAGQLACEAFNFGLKRLIKEERPRGRIPYGKGYGMPSSHAQFVAFWAVYLALFLLIRHTPKAASGPVRGASASVGGAHTGGWGSFVERLVISMAALLVAAGVAWSRIYLNYHTVRQVLAGWMAGMICAVVWFAITSVVRNMGLLAWALELPIVRWLKVRDLVLQEDPAQAGWEKWESMRKEKKGVGKTE